jgi:hypothetical protein
VATLLHAEGMAAISRAVSEPPATTPPVDNDNESSFEEFALDTAAANSRTKSSGDVFGLGNDSSQRSALFSADEMTFTNSGGGA